MTESSDNPVGPPPERRENPEQTPGSVSPYHYQQAQYPYAPGYPPPPYYGSPPPGAPKNGLGIASLILAVMALLIVWSVIGGVVLGIAAVVTGFLARARVKRREANNGGVAVSGIVLGFLGIAVGLAFIPIWVALWKDVGGDNYFDCLENAGADRGRQQQCADQFRENVQDRYGVTTTSPNP